MNSPGELNPDKSSPSSNKLVDKSSQTSESSDALEEKKSKPKAPQGPFNGPLENMLINPLMQQFDSVISEQTKILDEMIEKQETLKRTDEKARLTQHIPGPLKDEDVISRGQDIKNIWKLIVNLLTYANYDEETNEEELQKVELRSLSPNTYTCLASNAVGAWMSTLNRHHFEHLFTRIYSDTSLWISRIWRFKDSQSFFHDDLWQGILGMCRLALNEKYPKIATDGFQALFSKPPVIYLSTAAPPGLAQYLTSHLNLPSSSVCLVPNSFLQFGDECIDVNSFQQMVNNDLDVGKSPLLLLAYAGTRITGTVDNLASLATICKNHKIWLHVEGLKLAQLALLSVPTSVAGANERVDSMTLELGTWLGIPGVPFVTQFKTSIDETLLKDLNVTSPSPDSNRISVFPLWVALQTMGHDGIVTRIKSANNVISQVVKTLSTMPNIEIMKSRRKKDGSEQINTGISGIVGTILSFLLAGSTSDPVVTFRFTKNIEEKPTSPDREVAPYSSKKKSSNQSPTVRTPKFIDDAEDRYYSALNHWLCETLQNSFPRFGLIPIEINGEGVCLRLCPLESPQLSQITPEEIKKFTEDIKLHVSIITATMTKRTEFREVVEVQDKLKLVQLDEWAGLGAVIYIPQICNEVESLSKLSPQARNELNSINRELVCKLRSEDGAFSLGNAGPNTCCVRFGLITTDTDVEELVAMVIATGLECEEASRYMEKLTELIKQGIESASNDLEKEHLERVKQEGVLRQVPYLDSLVNWWSPPAKDPTVGRTFNLTSGQLATTEDTYRYKIQLSTLPPGSSAKLPKMSTALLASSTEHSTGIQNNQEASYKHLLKPKKSVNNADNSPNVTNTPPKSPTADSSQVSD